MKFATYTRDSYTGLDYADQRYFASTYGRFNTPDPKFNSANPSDPGTINRYSYVAGDPVNRRDPSGLAFVCAYAGDGCDCDDPFDAACSAPGGGGGDCFLACSPEPDPNPAPTPTTAPDPAPLPTCGQSLSSAGILPASSAGIALDSVLLGENSWAFIGTNQYQNGDKLGTPTGQTITAATVANEDSLMLDVIANLASAHDLSLTAQASAPGVFVGFAHGSSLFSSDQSAALGSSACSDLTVASLAYDSFAAGGSAARTSYNQWRGVLQGPRGHTFVRHQGPGDLRVGRTDFFTVPHP